MTHTLNIALIHLNVRHKDVEGNVKRLLELNRKAARDGHKIIVNTEMGLSGYSFSSADDIRPHALNNVSKPVEALCDLAREFKVFICLGLALEDPDTGILSNGALVMGPEGTLLCRYHKINAEARWACPGDPCQNNLFSTPWGKVGVLICADSYHGLLARQTALKGADLILVSANWPPTGRLDPREIWSIRARENGIYLAACNRTGIDLTMDCKDAPSGVFSPDGTPLICHTHPSSMVMSAKIPLDQGKIPSQRKKALASRSPGQYAPIYLDSRYTTNDPARLTDWHGLNPPGILWVTAFTAPSLSADKRGAFDCETVGHAVNLQRQTLNGSDTPEFTLMVFPQIDGDGSRINTLLDLLAPNLSQNNLALCLSRLTRSGSREIILAAPGHGLIRHRQDGDGYGPGPRGTTIVDTGPVRMGICLPRDLHHPETGVAHAKLGCDLLVSSMDTVETGERIVMAGRSMDKVAVAVAGTECAFVCAPPKGHDRFAEVLVQRPALTADSVSGPTSGAEPDTWPHQAEMSLDAGELRKRIFQDRIDFQTLLARSYD